MKDDRWYMTRLEELVVMAIWAIADPSLPENTVVDACDLVIRIMRKCAKVERRAS